jgi:hypothetical protein
MRGDASARDTSDVSVSPMSARGGGGAGRAGLAWSGAFCRQFCRHRADDGRPASAHGPHERRQHWANPGTEEGARTPTALRPAEFKSAASAYSATPARQSCSVAGAVDSEHAPEPGAPLGLCPGRQIPTGSGSCLAPLRAQYYTGYHAPRRHRGSIVRLPVEVEIHCTWGASSRCARRAYAWG